ncbi:MAG: MATE family efflux transporter [Proteobacteria bacterium]|nr:MATE family efflux transporter [Pseudomonadota bacterium]
MNNSSEKTKSTQSASLPEASRQKQILKLSLPITISILGFASVGLIDVGMVGRLGDVSLAAIGLANSLFFMLFVITMGLGTGVQTLAAMQVGEGNLHLSGKDLNGGLLLGMALGLILMVIGYIALPFCVSYMNQDPEVVGQGIAYLNTRMPQLLLFVLCFLFRSYWNGIGKPQITLLEMTSAIILNTVFNYLLIFGKFGFPEMGASGAGLSTTLAQFCTLIVYLAIGIGRLQINGFLRGLPDKERIRSLIQLSVPVSVSQFFATISLSVLFFMVGFLGTRETAAFNVMNNIMVTIILIADAMGFATITFIGQAMGRKDIPGAKKWAWDVSKTGVGVLLIFAILVGLFPQAILSVFIVDPDTIAIVLAPLRVSIGNILVIGFFTIMCAAFVGAGAPKTSLALTLIIQWCLMLPLQWILGIYTGFGLMGIVLGFLIAYTIGGFLVSFIWYKEGWSRSRLW